MVETYEGFLFGLNRKFHESDFNAKFHDHKDFRLVAVMGIGKCRSAWQWCFCEIRAPAAGRERRACEAD